MPVACQPVYVQSVYLLVSADKHVICPMLFNCHPCRCSKRHFQNLAKSGRWEQIGADHKPTSDR